MYVGQTGRTLANRVKERKLALTSHSLAQSALAEHAAQQSYDNDREGATVMDVKQQFHWRCILESWHFWLNASTMNRDES